MCQIVQDVRILRVFFFSEQNLGKFFCLPDRMSGKGFQLSERLQKDYKFLSDVTGCQKNLSVGLHTFHCTTKL